MAEFDCAAVCRVAPVAPVPPFSDAKISTNLLVRKEMEMASFGVASVSPLHDPSRWISLVAKVSKY